MRQKLKAVFEGSIYIYVISLILTALLLTIITIHQALQGNYWNGLVTLISSGVAFGLMMLAAPFLRVDES